MQSNFFLKLFYLLVFISQWVGAQDSIPQNQAVDTTVIDTVVIRQEQFKVKNKPRGVNLRSNFISFNQTKTLNEPYWRFRVPSFWEKVNKLGFTASEVAFVNWNAGGNSSITGIANGSFERNYKFRYIQWSNKLDMRFGTNIQEGQGPRKTDDAIRFSSAFSYRRDTLSNWYYSARLNFNTQFAKGFNYPDRETPISRFMAPGYLFFGAGISYLPQGSKFNIYISPLTLKSTFVLDQALADSGAFGVQKAILNPDGSIRAPGEKTFMELGFLINQNWETTVAKNVVMRHGLSLYTDYISSFGNIDIDWELNFDLAVNKYIKANIGTHIIYDDDILFNEVLDANGTVLEPGVQRIQFKQILGVGLTYAF